jgi:RNA polymerase-binding transcription factor DksA
MNTMMLALLQGRLWDTASSLQQQLQGGETETSIDATADELGEVFRALDALQAGRYGLCADCGCALDIDELLRKPQRLLCTACESGADHAGLHAWAMVQRVSLRSGGAAQPLS